METALYDILRQFADSWGLLYMMAIFIVVVVMVLLPGAKAQALAAARIPIEDGETNGK